MPRGLRASFRLDAMIRRASRRWLSSASSAIWSNRMPMRAVQELVGHQDLTMTQRYSHLSPAALVDTIRLLESRVVESGVEKYWRRPKAAIER